MAKILLNVEINQGAYLEQLKKMQAEINNLTAGLNRNGGIGGNSTVKSINNLQKSYANLLNTLKNTKSSYPSGTFDKLQQEITRCLNRIKNLNAQIGNKKPTETQQKQLNQLNTQYSRLSATLATTRAETEKHTTAVVKNGDSILAMAKKFVIWQAAATLVMKPIQMIRDAWNSVNDTLVKTEDAVVSLRRVAGEAANADELYDLAQRYGQTFENVYEISLNFARTGMDWADTIKATESALLALNVAELDATQASDGMIAIMQQFGYEADQLTLIVDKLNITADNAAVSTEKLLTALQRTGSSAVNANLSLEETIGIVTALSEATGRSGQNIGTAVNSLIQFSTKAESLDVFASLGGSVAETVEAYRHGSADVLDIWRELGKVIQDTNAENTAITDLFKDDNWQSLNQELQDALGENFATVNEIYGTASTFRKNYFIALLNNLDQVDESLATMRQATGYSQAENEQYLDTYTAKVNALQAKWQDIANDEQGLLGIKKDLIDIASKILTVIEYTGGLRTTLGALATVVASLFGKQIITAFLTYLTKAGNALKAFGTNIVAIFKKGEFAAMSLNAKLGVIGLIATAANMIIGGIQQGVEDAREAAEEAERLQAEANAAVVAKANENATAYKNEAQALSEYADKVKELREIVDSTTDGEKENTDAKNQLLEIQKSLIEYNKDYADSLDLVNGNLADQLGLIEELSSKQLKQKAQEFLDSNSTAIKTAENALNSTSTTNTSMLLSGVANDRFNFRDIINSAISGAGVGDNASIIEDNTYGGLHQWGKDIEEGWNEGGLFGALGGLLEGALWVDSEDWTGDASAGFSFSGTVEEQLDAINKLKEYIVNNSESLGLSTNDTNLITTELQKRYNELNSDDYKNAALLQERAKLAEDYINGKITEEEYLKEFYGITRELNEGGLVNTLEELNDTLKDKILTELEALRSTEEKSNALEEKRQALENAKNQRTVRVFNAETGQWEQVANQKDIQKAEEAYEDEAYKQIEDLLKDENRSTEAMVQLLATIAGVMPEISEKVSGILADNGIELPTYDSGGVLSGLGGIKATTKDEIVLPPNIAEKILQPTSNEQFRNFTKSLGILFGASERVGATTSNGIVYNNSRGGDTVNSNNSTQQYINGVQIPQNAQHYTIAELFETMALTNNN